MKRLIRFLHLLKKDEKGNVLIIVAASLIVLMGMTALVVDVGQLYSARRQMVNAADGAALAGVIEAKHTNKNSSRQKAKEYALYNGANEIFDQNKDIYYTGDGDAVIISVRVFSNEVEHTFARVLGFDNSIVPAIASAQVGPGNALTPLLDLGWECEDCAGVDCVNCGGLGYYIKTVFEGTDAFDKDHYKNAEFGDHFQVKFDLYKEWLGSNPGMFPYLKLPGQTGAQGLKENIEEGYTGDIDDVKIGEVHPSQQGSIADVRRSILTRMAIHGEPYCTFNGTDYSIANHCSGWYKCDLVLVMPIVIYDSHPNFYRIVGYASLLIDTDQDLSPGSKTLWFYFIEYLTWEDLLEVLPDQLEGFVTRLVQDPQEALNYFETSR